MFKTIAVIASTLMFTTLGIIAGSIIVLNRPANFHDPEGFITIMMVLAPTMGGSVLGLIVGCIAAGLSGGKGS